MVKSTTQVSLNREGDWYYVSIEDGDMIFIENCRLGFRASSFYEAKKLAYEWLSKNAFNIDYTII